MYGQSLLSSSQRATARSESRYRIDYPLVSTRGARVIALDKGAEKIVSKAAAHQWQAAHFFAVDTSKSSESYIDGSVEVTLRSFGGNTMPLNKELDQVDVVVMVATQDGGAAAATTIAAACTVRGIMTAGIIATTDADSTVAALRPHARILIISADKNDLEYLLSAIRA